MKNQLKQTLIFSLLMAMFVGIFSGTSVLAYGSSDRWRDTNLLSSWMNLSWEDIKDTRYCDLIVPGTHDTGTYRLSSKMFDPGAVSKDFPSEIKHAPGDIKNLVGEIIQNKSRCQEVDVYQQLREGNRFLDLRFKRYSKDHKLRVFHGLFGEEIRSILNQVKRFLDDSYSSREIIFINLNRYGEMHDLTVEDKRAIGRITNEILGEYIIPESEFDFTMTLDEINKTGKRIILNAGYPEIAETVTTSLPARYSINQAQKGSYKYSVVLESVKAKYNKDYKYTSDTEYLNTPFQIKLQLGWKPDEEFDPIVDKLKHLDIVGATKKLKSLLNSSIKGQTEKNRDEVLKTINTLASDAEANEPNIWMRDFYTKREIISIIKRNFGKTADSRSSYIEKISDRIAAGDESKSTEDYYNLLRLCLLTDGVGNYPEGEVIATKGSLSIDRRYRMWMENPTDDTFVYKKHKNENFGSDGYMFVKRKKGTHEYTRHSILKFDVREFMKENKNKRVKDATLILEGLDKTGENALYISSNDQWNEKNLTFNNGKSVYDSNLTHIKDFNVSKGVFGIDITAVFNMGQIKDGIITFVIKDSKGQDDEFLLSTKENFNSELAPRLMIKY